MDTATMLRNGRRQERLHEQRRRRRRRAVLVALLGLGLLLALAFWWANRQSEPAPPVAPATPTTAAPVAESSSLEIERSDGAIRLTGTVKTESERQALLSAVTDAGLVADDQLTVSPSVDDSDPRVVAALLAPLLRGTGNGGLSLADGTVTVTGEALDPVEAEEIGSAIATATAAGLVVEDQTTVRVLSEEVQITALQEEIDQIFELARELDGQYPNFESSIDELSPGAVATLDRVSVAMRRYPLPAADIIGHTDSSGSDEINQALSEERATTVMTYLVDAGVEPDRLQAIGRGAAEPVADNETEAGRAENRRVDFVVKQRAG